MVLRRENRLRQLGITQWVLRSPSALQGAVAVELPTTTKLLLVSENRLPFEHPVLQDIFHALHVLPQQVSCLTSKQIVMLPAETACMSWWLGVEPVVLNGIKLITPEWGQFFNNARAKRAFWQQLCVYETNIATTT